MTYRDGTAEILVAMSRAFDDHNAHRDSEAVTWGRLAKVAEEVGEVIEAMIAFTGQNPRKPWGASAERIIKELLDVAFTALCAVEHMTNHSETAMDLFDDHARQIRDRHAEQVGKGK